MRSIPDLRNPELLLKIISQSQVAMAIYETEDIIIRFANHAMLNFWGKDESIIGQPLEDAVPEFRNQPFKKMLQDVLKSGIIDKGVIPATTLVNGELKTSYYDYQYEPVKNEDGIAYSIIHTAKDVTELQLAYEEKLQLSDYFATVNEELLVANEELRTANEELGYAQAKLSATFLELEEKEITLRLAIEAADFGTWNIHSGTRNFITSPRLRELFGYRGDETITIEDALAQITDEYRPFVAQTLENAIYNNGDYDVTYPVIGFHDNKPRWLRAIGNLKADPSGNFSAFTGVVMDVSELKQNEERKDGFIAMVSHELKTPLTSLNAYLQILQLKKSKSGDTATADALGKALKQVKRMTTMISSFLNISRLESGEIQIDKQEFDMADLIGELKEETSTLYTSHQIRFTPGTSIIVKADYDKIGQVITNLISNAVKYSPPNSNIELFYRSVGGAVEVSVRDHGIGIREEDIPKLFERYYRIENQTPISGFGIGLYLCLEIINRHDGEILVKSELGRGSVFTFIIPALP